MRSNGIQSIILVFTILQLDRTASSSNMMIRNQIKMVSDFQKKIYANNENYYLCFWTSLGIQCALNKVNTSSHKNLLLGKKSKEGPATHCYQEQLLGIILYNKEEVENHICIEHMNVYGLQEGSATSEFWGPHILHL